MQAIRVALPKVEDVYLGLVDRFDRPHPRVHSQGLGAVNTRYRNPVSSLDRLHQITMGVKGYGMRRLTCRHIVWKDKKGFSDPTPFAPTRGKGPIFFIWKSGFNIPSRTGREPASKNVCRPAGKPTFYFDDPTCLVKFKRRQCSYLPTNIFGGIYVRERGTYHPYHTHQVSPSGHAETRVITWNRNKSPLSLGRGGNGTPLAASTHRFCHIYRRPSLRFNFKEPKRPGDSWSLMICLSMKRDRLWMRRKECVDWQWEHTLGSSNLPLSTSTSS